MNWEERKKQIAKRQQEIQVMQIWADYEYIQAQKQKIDLAHKMPLPCEARAEKLLPIFKAHVERKAKNDKVPDHEIELLHGILEVLENMLPERESFTTELSRLHNEQARYWEQQARAKSVAQKEMDKAFRSQSELLTTLFEIHESKGNP